MVVVVVEADSTQPCRGGLKNTKKNNQSIKPNYARYLYLFENFTVEKKRDEVLVCIVTSGPGIFFENTKHS